MCEGASKQSSDLKNYTAPGPRPPVFKFLDPPLDSASVVLEKTFLKSQMLLFFFKKC